MKKDQYVERALERYPITRSSDAHLIFAVWQMQGAGFSESQRKFLLDRAIKPESITRARRKLQQHGKYPPTQEVQEHRERKFREIRESAPRVNRPEWMNL